MPCTWLVHAHSQQGAPVLRNEELENRVIPRQLPELSLNRYL